LVVVVSLVVVTADGAGYVVVLVVESDATPLVLPYVVLEESVRVPSTPTDFSLDVVLNVPDGTAKGVGDVVVVVCELDICAMATLVIRPSAAAPASRNFVMSCPSED
jgi:hypothetical protein